MAPGHSAHTESREHGGWYSSLLDHGSDFTLVFLTRSLSLNPTASADNLQGRAGEVGISYTAHYCGHVANGDHSTETFGAFRFHILQGSMWLVLMHLRLMFEHILNGAASAEGGGCGA